MQICLILLKGGYGVTEYGASVDLQKMDFDKLVKDIRQGFPSSNTKESEVKEKLQDEEDVIDQEDYQKELLGILRELPPAGFERLCQRLLRESDFERVEVTGRSGDGGIDGIGLLQINPFVSFRVLFQCKRYQGSVTPSQVRDFRGAMMGRADKGIILTTGTFTVEAKKEAHRDGVPPIELVDSDDLIHLFEILELGLKSKTVFDIDAKFFDEFRK